MVSVSTRWLAKRKPHWQRLEQLVDRSGRRGVAALGHGELQELGLLYRQTASDLATVREDITSRSFSSYLNQLLSRAHNLIYMGRRPNWGGIVSFYVDTYPRIFRETFPLVVLSALIFATGGIAGAVVTLRDPGFAHQVLGPQMLETIEKREMWTHSILAVKPMAASGIMTNNIAVGFAMFAAGITAGLGTLWMLITNGLLMGVLTVVTARAGMALELWDFVAAHGALELPAIFIAAGAGLEIASGLLFPGRMTRKESLRQAGNRGTKLLLGTLPLLVIAGVIEAYVSPVKIATPLKFLLSAALFAALVLYLSSGKQDPAPKEN
ncbi:MAG TPA: stage II sporulation protein M [Candidatus Acidoferrales bacterium]|jgi:uncharacterized membrane protein SpoIIM required for sporulation|nr:stage II sporulation protein M [Candidatus Acidoferrales bacterium]